MNITRRVAVIFIKFTPTPLSFLFPPVPVQHVYSEWMAVHQSQAGRVISNCCQIFSLKTMLMTLMFLMKWVVQPP